MADTVDYNKLTVSQLKAELQSRALDDKGKKGDLIDRLVKHDEERKMDELLEDEEEDEHAESNGQQQDEEIEHDTSGQGEADNQGEHENADGDHGEEEAGEEKGEEEGDEHVDDAGSEALDYIEVEEQEDMNEDEDHGGEHDTEDQGEADTSNADATEKDTSTESKPQEVKEESTENTDKSVDKSEEKEEEVSEKKVKEETLVDPKTEKAEVLPLSEDEIKILEEKAKEEQVERQKLFKRRYIYRVGKNAVTVWLDDSRMKKYLLITPFELEHLENEIIAQYMKTAAGVNLCLSSAVGEFGWLELQFKSNKEANAAKVKLSEIFKGLEVRATDSAHVKSVINQWEQRKSNARSKDFDEQFRNCLLLSTLELNDEEASTVKNEEIEDAVREAFPGALTVTIPPSSDLTDTRFILVEYPSKDQASAALDAAKNKDIKVAEHTLTFNAYHKLWTEQKAIQKQENEQYAKLKPVKNIPGKPQQKNPPLTEEEKTGPMLEDEDRKATGTKIFQIYKSLELIKKGELSAENKEARIKLLNSELGKLRYKMRIDDARRKNNGLPHLRWNPNSKDFDDNDKNTMIKKKKPTRTKNNQMNTGVKRPRTQSNSRDQPPSKQIRIGPQGLFTQKNRQPAQARIGLVTSPRGRGGQQVNMNRGQQRFSNQVQQRSYSNQAVPQITVQNRGRTQTRGSFQKSSGSQRNVQVQSASQIRVNIQGRSQSQQGYNQRQGNTRGGMNARSSNTRAPSMMQQRSQSGSRQQWQQSSGSYGRMSGSNMGSGMGGDYGMGASNQSSAAFSGNSGGAVDNPTNPVQLLLGLSKVLSNQIKQMDGTPSGATSNYQSGNQYGAGSRSGYDYNDSYGSGNQGGYGGGGSYGGNTGYY